MEALSIWAVVTKCPKAVRPWTAELISFSYSEDREVHIRQPQCLVRAHFLTQGWCLHNMSFQSRKGKAAFGGWALFHKDIYPVIKILLEAGPSIQPRLHLFLLSHLRVRFQSLNVDGRQKTPEHYNRLIKEDQLGRAGSCGVEQCMRLFSIATHFLLLSYNA